MRGPINVPDLVRRKALEADARGWLVALPELVEALEAEWDIEVGRAMQGGTESFVAEALTDDGTPVVLKLLVPHGRGGAADEITTLRLAGDSCVGLLRSNASQGAMLLERLGPTLADMALPIARRHEIMCDAAAGLWRSAPDCGLRTGAEKAAWLADEIQVTWERLGRPCSARVIDHAIECAHRRATQHDDERAVLVHGDVHQWNTLATLPGASRPYKLIDPDGLLADAEYDLGIIMREDPEHGLHDPRARSRWLAERTGCDEVRIWEWGVIERVSTGLLTIVLGGEIEPIGRAMLATAEVASAC